MRSLKDLAKEALEIQNACNTCGLVQRFAKVLIELGECTGGTQERNSHPITILWLDKLNSLAGIQDLNNTAIGDAYQWAFKITKENDQ